MVIKKNFSKKMFDGFNVVLMIALALACLIPLWHVMMASVSDPAMVDSAKGFVIRPLGEISLKAYKLIFQYRGIWIGYRNTVFYVIAQCVISASLTTVAGYALSRRRFRYRNVVMGFLAFTMLFNGGLIPTYMVVRKLGLLDTYAALLIPGALQVFFIIIMRTAIAGIPSGLEDSARIDGAGDVVILIKIVLPLAKATIAVIILFVAVAKWNEWFPALLYLPTAKDKYPLQMYLREILLKSQNVTNTNAADLMDDSAMYKTLAKYASIVVATLPILCVYPFVQKYFVTGVMIGSIKG